MTKTNKTTDPRNVHTTTGDSAHLVKDYDQLIQYRTYRTVCTAKFPQYGLDKPFAVTALVRFDDDCGNGHCTFSVTGTIPETDGRRAQRDPIMMCGCIHDVLAVAFPELRTAIKYHLVSTDGPMHYLANTCYHASDADHYGRRAWEVKIPREYSKGKARELDHARSNAVWPDATDAELSVPTEELRAVLLARLPGLMAEFRGVVESLGFDYEFPAKGGK